MPGDVFLIRRENLFGWLIRRFSRPIWRRAAMVNHVGIVIGVPNLGVEAIAKVACHNIYNHYGASREVHMAVYRPTNLALSEVRRITEAAQSYVGRGYGYVKLLAHFADWLLMGAYVFRRLIHRSNSPICSYLVAECFATVGKDFGIKARGASPEDIYQFVTRNPDKYRCIIELQPTEQLHATAD